MKVWCNGARHFGSQVPRIEDGFRALGHEVVESYSAADLVYSNDSHAQIVRDKLAGTLKPGAKLILTVLDLPLHIPNVAQVIEELRPQLAAADAVCSISRYVQWQLREYMGVESEIVYQPIMDVRHNPTLRVQPFPRFAHVGRRSDSNKRFDVGVAALQILGFGPRDLLLVGNEPGWGDYLGVQSEANLNRVYNSVDFVLCLGKVEGMGLTALEAMACGAVPVICNDLTTRQEFFPSQLFPEYDSVDPTPESVARFIAQFLEDGDRLAAFKRRLHDHYLMRWWYDLSAPGVAERIVGVYEGIK